MIILRERKRLTSASTMTRRGTADVASIPQELSEEAMDRIDWEKLILSCSTEKRKQKNYNV